MAQTITRALLKHLTDGTTYAIEQDFEGVILGALDVTTEIASGGFCIHMLPSLPLAGSLDTVELLNRTREDFDAFTPECGNVHHLFNDLLQYEKEHRAAQSAWAMAEAKAKSLKRDVEARAQKVHDLLGRLADQKPLPLFDGLAK